MIKVNVEVNTKYWYKKIKNPTKYFSKKLKKISKIIPHIKGKNIIFTILLTNSLNIKKLNKTFVNKKLVIYSSPLERAFRTAEIIAQGINYPKENIIIEERLNDFNLGEIAGTYGWDKVTELYPELASLRLNNPMHFHPPGGESGADFKARITEFMEEIADHKTPKLLVSHGIVNKFIRGIRKNLSGKKMIELGESQDTIYHLNNTQDQEIKVPDWLELIPN